MFKKLLANLPFNPSLIDQVGFYYNRLRHEAAIRRLGFLLIAAAVLVQFVAALYPPQQSLAASPNDVLDGINNKGDILSAWDANTNHIREVYSKFGIGRANISAINGQNPNSTVVSTSQDFWSIGHLPLSNFGISNSQWGERTINASGITVYERPLHAWDTHGSSSYPAYHGRNQYGQDFWILKTCGNPTFVGPYLPKPPAPRLTVHKTLLTSSVVHRGDIVKYRLEYQNTVADSLATNFRLRDTLNSNLDFISLDNMSSKSGSSLYIKHGGQLGYTSSPYFSTLTVRVKDNVANNTVICNLATVGSDQTSATSEKPCITVIVPATPTPTPAPPPAPTPTVTITPTSTPPSGYCIASSVLASGSVRSVIIQTSAYVSGDTKITGYSYDLDANGSIDAKNQTSAVSDKKQFDNLSNGEHTILVYVQLANARGQTAQSPACQAQININEQPRVILSKSVKNLTTNSDANSTTVNSGDILEFKLITQNVTGTNYKDYTGRDYFGSVLQYADLVDPSELTQQGMNLDSQNYLNWNVSSIAANQSNTKAIRVSVKKIIPSTNTPSTLSPDYNCKISNDYGNQVTLNVNCPIVKSVSQAATNLPNTGPGTSIAIGAAVAIMAGYFYSRARIMSRELAVVKKEYTASGGF